MYFWCLVNNNFMFCKAFASTNAASEYLKETYYDFENLQIQEKGIDNYEIYIKRPKKIQRFRLFKQQIED